MAENFSGISRLIRHLEEELIELETGGLYSRAEEVRQRLNTYLDMRDKAHTILHRIENERQE